MGTMRRIGEKGFTLIELLLVVSIISIIIGAIALPFRGGFQTWVKGDRHAEVMQNALISMDKITREIRQAQMIMGFSAPNDPNGYIEFIDKDGNSRKFHYDGTPDGYVQYGTPESLAPLAGPANRLTFNCYLENGDTPPPVPEDTKLVKIRLITFDVKKEVSDIPLSAMIYLASDRGIIPPSIPDCVGSGGGTSGDEDYRSHVYTIFGKEGVDLGNGTQVDGNVGTNGCIEWLSNNISINGNVISYGSVGLKNNVYVNGNVIAGAKEADLIEINNNAHVAGNIFTNGSVDISQNAIVDQHVQYGNKLTGDGYGTADYGKSSPARFRSLFPVPTYASSDDYPGWESAQNVTGQNNEIINLPPGAYYDLSMKNNSELHLYSGRYYFNSISLFNRSKVYIDLALSPSGFSGIEIFVGTGGIDIKNNYSITLLNAGDTNGAKKVYVEVLGNCVMKNNAEWSGTIFAPNSDIELDNNMIINGALYSGKTVQVKNDSMVNFVLADRLRL